MDVHQTIPGFIRLSSTCHQISTVPFAESLGKYSLIQLLADYLNIARKVLCLFIQFIGFYNKHYEISHCSFCLETTQSP